jgi:predicted secreted protein
MGITTFLAIYFILWWLVLFAVLPWGVHSQAESGDVMPGTDPGAPATHVVWRKLLWTTVIASVVFGVFYAVYRFELVPLEFLKRISTPPHQ